MRTTVGYGRVWDSELRGLAVCGKLRQHRLAALTPDEREALARWLSVYREGHARTKARAILASAPAHLESLVSALEVAADTMSAAEAAPVWAQLQAIARTLKRSGASASAAARCAPVAGAASRTARFRR